jgi:peptide subunit release factor 1 (eRF1)
MPEGAFMIDADRVTKLLTTHVPGSLVVSVYLTVPIEPAGRRGIPARLDDLLAAAQIGPGDGQMLERATRSELPVIRDTLAAHALEWLGHTVAVFSSRELGLLETIPLRSQAQERAVIADRPYVRPLLAELRRSPCYAAVVADRRHAWVYRVTGSGIEALASMEGATVGSRRFGGWHGFQMYRNQQRARKLARDHYAATVAALEDATQTHGCGPIAVGGHQAETASFVAELPQALRERVAGTFVIDPHTMTPARVRKLADEVVARWEDEREAAVAAQITGQPNGAMAAVGLPACLDAANEHAVQVLVVPDGAVAPGFACPRCGGLSVAGGACPLCGGPVRPVPDVIEELAVKVTMDGGTVEPVRGNGTAAVAARRRFPPPGVPSRAG